MTVITKNIYIMFMKPYMKLLLQCMVPKKNILMDAATVSTLNMHYNWSDIFHMQSSYEEHMTHAFLANSSMMPYSNQHGRD